MACALKKLKKWGSEKGYHYVCLGCGKTVNSVDTDGLCKFCSSSATNQRNKIIRGY